MFLKYRQYSYILIKYRPLIVSKPTLMDRYIQKLLDIYDSRKLAYEPQAVDYESIDKIVLDYYLKTYHKETQ